MKLRRNRRRHILAAGIVLIEKEANGFGEAGERPQQTTQLQASDSVGRKLADFFTTFVVFTETHNGESIR